MTTTKTHRSLYGNVQREQVDFGTTDKQGRAVGASIETYEVTYTEVTDAQLQPYQGYYRHAPGHFYAVRFWATRDGKGYGPCQPEKTFTTVTDRNIAIERYLVGARARALSKGGVRQGETIPAKSAPAIKLSTGGGWVTHTFCDRIGGDCQCDTHGEGHDSTICLCRPYGTICRLCEPDLVGGYAVCDRVNCFIPHGDHFYVDGRAFHYLFCPRHSGKQWAVAPYQFKYVTPDFTGLFNRVPGKGGWQVTDFRHCPPQSLTLPDVWEVSAKPGGATVNTLLHARTVFIHEATTIHIEPAKFHENSYRVEVR